MTSTTSLIPCHTVFHPESLCFSFCLLSSPYRITAATVTFLKYFLPLPWGLQNEVRFLHHQNLFLISIYIFLLFSTCTLEVTCYFWSMLHSSWPLCLKMFFPVSLMRELFFQGIRKLKYLYSFSFQFLRAKKKRSIPILYSHSTFYMSLIP